MSAAVVGELSEGRDMTEREGERGRIVKEYRRVFLVRTTNQNDNADVARAASGIPTRYFAFVTSTGTNSYAKLVEASARQKGKDPFTWEVECRYSTQPRKPLEEQLEEEEGPTSPLDEPPDIQFGDSSRRVPATKLYSGSALLADSAIVASNGEPYANAPEVEDGQTTLVISRNQATYDPLQSSQFRNAINNAPFWAWVAGRVRCDSITAQLQWNNGNGFWRVTYSFSIEENGWTLRVLNQGTYYLEGGDPTKQRTFLDRDGNRFTGLLAADGDKAVAPSYGSFQGYKSANFDTLALPDWYA